MIRLCLSDVLFAMLMLSLTACGAAASPPNAGMSVRLMSWEGELTDLWLADGTAFLPARAGEFILGRAVFLNRRTPTMRVFREQTVDGAKRKFPVADVPLPEETSSVLVILAPAPAGSPFPIQGRALDQSLEMHPLNTVRVVNFSNRTLAFRVGEKTAVSEPGADARFPFPTGGSPQVPVEVAVKTSEGWQSVQRSLQPAPAGRRILVVVRDGRPDLSIQDPALRTKPVDAVFLIDRAPPAPVTVAQK